MLEMLDLEIEELYHPCSVNKGADQSYCEADLRLCIIFYTPSPRHPLHIIMKSAMLDVSFIYIFLFNMQVLLAVLKFKRLYTETRKVCF